MPYFSDDNQWPISPWWTRQTPSDLPAVTSYSPTSGSGNGGTALTFVGRNLANTTGVTFGASSPVSVTSLTDTGFDVTTPSIHLTADPALNMLVNYVDPTLKVDDNADGIPNGWSPFITEGTTTVDSSGWHVGTTATQALISPLIPATAGVAYDLSAYGDFSALAGNFVLKIEWYGSDGVTLIDYGYDQWTAELGGRTQFSHHGTAPAGTVSLKATVSVEGSGGTGVIDTALLVSGSVNVVVKSDSGDTTVADRYIYTDA